VSRLIVLALSLPILLYKRLISPLLGPRCRYHPSCSTYALQALRTHGPVRGLALAGWRLLRCNPWSLGGPDPVPPPRSRARERQ
jgi:putative membrane protein insertion efficiency factor